MSSCPQGFPRAQRCRSLSRWTASRVIQLRSQLADTAPRACLTALFQSVILRALVQSESLSRRSLLSPKRARPRNPKKSLTGPGALDMLAFGTHPDDLEIACGGTLRLLSARGHRVGACDLTRGE